MQTSGGRSPPPPVELSRIMPLSHRQNYLRTITRTGPEWIPASVVISGASMNDYFSEMQDVMARHPVIFPGFQRQERPPERHFGPRGANEYTDTWGCVWETGVEGLSGVVLRAPLEDWAAFADYSLPDPLTQSDFGPFDWEAARRNVEAGREAGSLTAGGFEHGFFIMRLWYLRGFANMMVDLASDEPRMHELVEKLIAYASARVAKWLEFGVDIIHFGDDMGTQTASLVSPAMFARWFTPAYRRIFQPCRDAGTHVFLHSDGHVIELVDEFIAAGVDVVNIQDLCNGIDDLAREVKGRVSLELDIDRQSILPYGTRGEIRALIEEEVRKLGSPEGGLSFIAGIYPPTPPENVDALCEALEEFRTFWW
jgi:uroporphyrinogen decarboxylase